MNYSRGTYVAIPLRCRCSIIITYRIQPYELRMRSSGRLDTCIELETARNEPVYLATAVRELVLQAVFL